MNRFGIIYLCTNKITGEQYIGQTCQNIKKRITNHKCSMKTYKTKFSEALNKYKFESFVFDEIFYAFDEESLHQAEKLLIEEFKPVYNMTKGGSGVKGYIPPKEVVIKRSISLKKTLQDPVIRSKWGKANIGRKKSQDDIAKTAKAKWKPVYCKELAISFLNQKYAADFFGTVAGNISQLIANKGKVKNKYTLVRVI